MKTHYLLPLFLLLLFACKTETPDSNNESDLENVSTEKIDKLNKQKKPTKMTVGLESLRLRASPGEDGKQVAYLDKGAILYETGEVSDFTTRIKLRGIWFDEPWIKVKTEDGTEGWVYGGAVVFDMENPTMLANKLLDLRLRSFFGNELSEQMHSYRKLYNSATTSKDFSKVFAMGQQLRDTLVTILEKKINVLELDYEQLPDLFWVEEGLPGYETALVAEGTIYYLLQNFKKFKKLAHNTSGKEDDEFVEINLKVHASDSVEYFFPSWFLQTWDYGGHSLLGQGTHLDILETCDQALKKSDLFLKDIVIIKDQIISDIVGKHITYWENQEKISSELDSILKADLDILTNDDLIAIKTRRNMFDNPKANKIEVDHKSGMGG